MHLSEEFKLLCLLILWRLISVFIVQTAHVPDEYWQSLEVAHHLAFDYGYLTWEWRKMIRSYSYPFLISILYRILAAFSLDFTVLLMTLPRVFQAILVGYSDYRFYKWIGCKWALLVLCTNWYWYYCATRTLINSVETACSIIAFSMFPWMENSVFKSIKYMWIVSFLCMARPTATIIWFPLCLSHILSVTTKDKKQFLIRYAMICLSCFLISILIDSYCYGKFVITPLKFFLVNVLEGVASTYGTKNLLWYVIIGLPVILGLYSIPFMMSVWRIFHHSNIYHQEIAMFKIIVIVLIIYSIIPHKEFRFILPLLPLCIYIGSRCYRLNIRMSSHKCWIFAALLMLTNFLPGIYFSLIHQRGTIDVMNYLRDEISHANISSTKILILTPCHATPLYSHLHVNASIKFLTCEPNFDRKFYVNEANEFFKSPLIWLDRYTQIAGLPTYVIAFDNIAEKIKTTFLYKYKMIAKIFHTHFPEENYGTYILLYKQDIHV